MDISTLLLQPLTITSMHATQQTSRIRWTSTHIEHDDDDDVETKLYHFLFRSASSWALRFLLATDEPGMWRKFAFNQRNRMDDVTPTSCGMAME